MYSGTMNRCLRLPGSTRDGSPDSTFGTNGAVVTMPFNQGLFNPTALALQPDGKILLAGT
jgi:hypothetical protein